MVSLHRVANTYPNCLRPQDCYSLHLLTAKKEMAVGFWKRPNGDRGDENKGDGERVGHLHFPPQGGMGRETGSEYQAEDFARSRCGSGGQQSWQASESGPEEWPFSVSLSP